MDFLLRSWGGDLEKVTKEFPPDKWEKGDHVACWWLDSPAVRDAFIASWPQGAINVVPDKHDPGYDSDGEFIDTRKRTIAHVTLKTPAGEIATLHHDFGYGYPVHSAHYMYLEGNYSCDCNLRDFLEAQCGIDVPGDGCGESIKILKIECTHEE